MLVFYEGDIYTVVGNDLKDQILYEVYQGDEYICTIGRNENGLWEATEDVDPNMVKYIGEQVD